MINQYIVATFFIVASMIVIAFVPFIYQYIDSVLKKTNIKKIN